MAERLRLVYPPDTVSEEINLCSVCRSPIRAGSWVRARWLLWCCYVTCTPCARTVAGKRTPRLEEVEFVTESAEEFV